MTPLGIVLQQEWFDSLATMQTNSQSEPILSYPNAYRNPSNVLEGRQTAGSLSLDKLRLLNLMIGLLRRTPIAIAQSIFMLQDYAIKQAPKAAVVNQEIHGSTVVNSPEYIGGQFTF